MLSVNKVNTVVIKLGSSLVTSNGFGIDYDMLNNLAYQVSELKKKGIRVIVVSSGAIAEGMKRLGWRLRPSVISKLQAAASVGQMALIKSYEDSFNKYNMRTAQILLTHDDVKSRIRYLNLRNTISTLLNLGTVPIINENDSVSFREIKFGDNDTLGALVVNLIDADALIILTDCEGLFEDDPKKNSKAKIINKISVIDPKLELVAKDSNSIIGKGGMITKVMAAKMASESGAWTVIASGFDKEVILKILLGEEIGTYFIPVNNKLSAKRKWMKDNLIISGYVYVDNGAKEALIRKNSSLLPIGCIKIEGDFKRGELISIKDKTGVEIARGLSNYCSKDAEKILRTSSSDIIHVLGFIFEEELVHKDNMLIYKLH